MYCKYSKIISKALMKRHCCIRFLSKYRTLWLIRIIDFQIYKILFIPFQNTGNFYDNVKIYFEELFFELMYLYIQIMLYIGR